MVNPAKLLPHTAHSGWINRTGLTSWAFTRWRDRHTSDKVTHYLIYRPRKHERLSWPSWLTYSGRFTGHPSATDRAWDRESSPVRDRRSTTVPRSQQLIESMLYNTFLLPTRQQLIVISDRRKGRGVRERFYVTCLREHFIGGVFDNLPYAIIR